MALSGVPGLTAMARCGKVTREGACPGWWADAIFGEMNRMSQEFARELEERLIRYARIDTQSDESSPTLPSTGKQFDLLRLLMDELKSIGAQDVTLTDYGAVLATIPATGDTDAPAIAFLGHVDTSPAFSGTGVTPIVHRATRRRDPVPG